MPAEVGSLVLSVVSLVFCILLFAFVKAVEGEMKDSLKIRSDELQEAISALNASREELRLNAVLVEAMRERLNLLETPPAVAVEHAERHEAHHASEPQPHVRHMHGDY